MFVQECRGKFRTDPTGRFKIVTTFPGRYLNDEAEANSYRPAHVHFKITPDDPKYQPTLTTQLYFMHGTKIVLVNILGGKLKIQMSSLEPTIHVRTLRAIREILP